MTKHDQSALSLFEDVGLSPHGSRELAASQLTNDALVLLQEALSQRGISQKQLAEILGIGESRVSQVVNGDGNVKLTTFARYMKSLGYSVTIDVNPENNSVPELSRKRRQKPISPPAARVVSP